MPTSEIVELLISCTRPRMVDGENAARYLTGTLDVLHVAAALLLEAKTLASFDDRPRRLAASVGFQLLPETLR